MNQLMNNPIFAESQRKQREETQALLQALGTIKHEDIKTQAAPPTVYIYPDFWRKIPYERIEKADVASIKIYLKEMINIPFEWRSKNKSHEPGHTLSGTTKNAKIVIDIEKMSTKFETRDEIITIPAPTNVTHKTPTISSQADLLKFIAEMTEHNCLIIGPALGWIEGTMKQWPER